MSRSILILCQDNNEVTFQEIMQFIKDGYYFDEQPEFEIHEDRIIIHYDLDVRPITIEIFTDSKIVEEIKQERYEVVTDNIKKSSVSNDEELTSKILSRVMASKNIYRIEFSYDDLSEDCWGMKAAVESFLATEKKGLILADEGIYDSNLKLIVSFWVL